MTNNTVTTVRVTKAQKLNAIINALNRCADSYDEQPVMISGTTLKDGSTREGVILDSAALIEFCKNEIEALSRKTTSNSGKLQTEKQKKNEAAQETILQYMRDNDITMERKQTVSEVWKSIPELMSVNNQQYTRYMNALVSAGSLAKTREGNKSYFYLA